MVMDWQAARPPGHPAHTERRRSPFLDCRDQLQAYDRDLIDLTTDPYLMRGHMDREHKAEPVFPLATDGGLVVTSQAIEAHLARIKAYRQQAAASQKAALNVAQAQQAAHDVILTAHSDFHNQHEEAQGKVQAAQEAANRRRQDAHERLQVAPQRAQQRIAAAKESADQHTAEARKQAEEIAASAQQQKRI